MATSTSPRLVRHAGIMAPLLRRDVEVEFIAPPRPGLHAHHGAAPRPPHAHPRPSGPLAAPTGPHCFEGLRYLPDGREDPDFVLNRDPFRDASILLAGENFGIGSLQGFAVARLLECGFRAVIAPSFGPVFLDDCFALGLLAATLPREAVAALAARVAAAPALETTVDPERREIGRADFAPVSLAVEPRLRRRLLLGDDGLDEALRHGDAARASREAARRLRPWIYDDSVPDP